MHGAGVLTFQADNYFTRTGTFTEGWFTPTFLEALETWGSYEPEFTLSPELKEFLLQYPWIWDEDNENLDYEGSEFRTEIQPGLYAGTYMTQPEEYAGGVWMRLTSYRIVEARTGIYFDNGIELTQITAVDSGYRQCWRFLVAGTDGGPAPGRPAGRLCGPLGAEYLYQHPGGGGALRGGPGGRHPGAGLAEIAGPGGKEHGELF